MYKTLISGHYRDKNGRTYLLALEPAIALENGHYVIRREYDIEVWEVQH